MKASPANQKRQPLFPITQVYPVFFNTNLVDEHRVIKVLKGEKASLRAFYYQLFKLAFQIEMQISIDESDELSFSDYITLIRKILTSVSDFEKTMEPQVSKINQFINLISQNSRLSFQIEIQLDQLIDAAMVAILSLFLQDADKEKSSVQEIFEYLCNIFRLTVNKYENCFRFAESDVFVYVNTKHQLYLAYLQPNEEESELKTKKGIEESRQKNIKSQKSDTIMNIFGDMLSSKNDGNQRNNIGDSGQYPTKESLKNEKEEELNNSQVNSYDFDKNKKLEEKSIKIETIEEEHPEDLFYRPKTNKISSVKEISTFKKDKGENSEEKGTFYRQFTDTRILKMLPEPHRTKVQILKNRFIGVHSSK